MTSFARCNRAVSGNLSIHPSLTTSNRVSCRAFPVVSISEIQGVDGRILLIQFAPRMPMLAFNDSGSHLDALISIRNSLAMTSPRKAAQLSTMDIGDYGGHSEGFRLL